jgi:hypothetical protein
VPNAHLIKRGDALCKVFKVVQVKIVPGVDAKPQLMCATSAACNIRVQQPALYFERVLGSVGLGIKLYSVGTGGSGAFTISINRVYKYRNADPRIFKYS